MGALSRGNGPTAGEYTCFGKGIDVGIAAFLCGLFYGAFFLAVHQKARKERLLDRGLSKLLQDVYPEPCEWPWGRDDLWQGHTGTEDG